MGKLKMSESLLKTLNSESQVSNHNKGDFTHAGFLLQLLQFLGGDRTSGQTLDPILKKYWSWAETNRKNVKRNRIKALIQSLSSENQSKGF